MNSHIHEIIKLNIIKNAHILGWNIVKLNRNKFVLSKKINELDYRERLNHDLIIDNLLNVTKMESFNPNISQNDVFA